jgi:flavodoxin
MKAKIVLSIIICLLLCTGATVFGQNTQTNNLGKVLILYYSFSDAANTERVANIIQGLVNADIVKVELARSFPDLEYRQFTQWVREQQEKQNYPEIKPIGVDMASYDFIIIGTPSWWYSLSTPIVTLLRQTDFKGKPVTVFGTHQGNGSKIFSDFASLVRNARIVKGELFGNVASDSQIEEKVARWVRGLRR